MRFWMVVGSGLTPVYRHQTLASAKTEAIRLAQQHRGSEFTVLEAVMSVFAGTVVVKSFNPDGTVTESDIPF